MTHPATKNKNARRAIRESMVIPAQTGILRHSREDENPPRHPSFPRRRESTIPAHAGIHRPTTPMPEKNTPSFPRRRESTIPFPRTREFIVPPPQRPKKNTPSFPRRQESTPSSVIPAKAGIHNSRARGNSSSHYPNTRKNTPSFPPSRE